MKMIKRQKNYYHRNVDQLEEEQEEETVITTNQVFKTRIHPPFDIANQSDDTL